MFGIPDPWVSSAFLLCLVSLVLCVVYGAINWNKGAGEENAEISEEAKWELEEEKISGKL